MIRALKRRLEVLNHQSPKPIQNNEGGERLLKAAIADKEERRTASNKDIYNCAYEAAGDLMNLGKGRVMSYGGFGSGYRLGTGKWKYINNRWVKKE